MPGKRKQRRLKANTAKRRRRLKNKLKART